MATPPAYPYGYKLNQKGRKDIDESKAKVVRLIYKKYLDGMSRHSINWYLIENKVIRPSGKTFDWQYTMVDKILKDERYIGTEIFPQILPEDTFEKAIEKRQNEQIKARTVRHESCNDNRKYPFSSFIECGSCGRKYVRGMQGWNRSENKPSWRCVNYRAKAEGKCKASGNLYEEVLYGACIKAYNKQLKEFSNKNVMQIKTPIQEEYKNSYDALIKETILLMKVATGEHHTELETALNMLIDKRTAISWDNATLDLTDFETEKIKKHFEENPKAMIEFDEARFKQVFEKIVALEPGELKLILKNGNEAFQDYKPMRGQVNNAKKCRSNTSQVT